MKKRAVVVLVGIASACIGAGILWVKMPPLGYDWAPQAITDWQSMRTAKALVRRELSDPGSADFQNVRISNKTFFGSKKKGVDADEENFFAVCGEVKDLNAQGGSTGFKQFAVHFDKAGGRGRAFVEPEETAMAALFESAMEPCR